MEGLKMANADLVVYIHPSMANKIKQAVLRQLSSMLFQFSEAFDGVVLAFEENIEGNKAKILSGIVPYFGVTVKAKLLVFSPKRDMLLEGKVVKFGKECIHVIVLGFSSAAITFEDIRPEFEYIAKHGEGVFASTKHRRHVIKVGSMIRFLVKSFDEEILHISGSLVPCHTGCIRWLYRYEIDGAQIDRSLKKEGEKNLEMELLGQNPQLDSANTSRLHRHTSKRKRNAGDS